MRYAMNVVNPLWRRPTLWYQITVSSLVMVNACRIFGTKLLFEPMPIHYQLDQWEHTWNWLGNPFKSFLWYIGDIIQVLWVNSLYWTCTFMCPHAMSLHHIVINPAECNPGSKVPFRLHFTNLIYIFRIDTVKQCNGVSSSSNFCSYLRNTY